MQKLYLFIYLFIFFGKNISAQIILSAATADNGLPEQSIIWKDVNNLQRSAVFVDQRLAGAGVI